MRGIAATFGLSLWLIGSLAGPALSFEIEAQKHFGATGAEVTIRVLSTTDIGQAAPAIEAFVARRPDLAVEYVVSSSQQVYGAIAEEGAEFDLVMSSAMDLQMKLANDGFAQALNLPAAAELPDWAQWRGQLFATSVEPVVMIVAARAFAGEPPPDTRRGLVDFLRDRPERFRGRIGTYDPRISGAGYLFATQEARQSDTFWRLSEVMGRLDVRLYCCSGDMIADLRGGRIDIAYNVVGAYAASALASDPEAQIVDLQDFTLALMRTGFVPVRSANPAEGAALLDYLVSAEGQRVTVAQTGFPTLDDRDLALAPHIRPIRLDTGLLVYLDPLARQGFLSEWQAAMTQQ